MLQLAWEKTFVYQGIQNAFIYLLIYAAAIQKQLKLFIDAHTCSLLWPTPQQNGPLPLV